MCLGKLVKSIVKLVNIAGSGDVLRCRASQCVGEFSWLNLQVGGRAGG